MAIRGKEEKDENPLDLTSMIDVVFLLLVFFMVATKFKEIERVLDANLPKDMGGPPKEEDEEREEIRIEIGQGQTKANIMVNKVMVQSYEQLYQKLLDLNNVMPDAPVIIDPKGGVEFGAVIQSLNACARARLVKISFARPALLEGPGSGK